MTGYDGLTRFPPPDADGLTRFAVPETDEEELIRLRAEVARLRAALDAVQHGENLEHMGDIARAALRGDEDIPENRWD